MEITYELIWVNITVTAWLSKYFRSIDYCLIVLFPDNFNILNSSFSILNNFLYRVWRIISYKIFYVLFYLLEKMNLKIFWYTLWCLLVRCQLYFRFCIIYLLILIIPITWRFKVKRLHKINEIEKKIVLYILILIK